jgi:hypothetical protein
MVPADIGKAAGIRRQIVKRNLIASEYRGTVSG